MAFGGDLLSIDSIDEYVRRKLAGERIDSDLAQRCTNDALQWYERGKKSESWYNQVLRVLG